MRRIKRKKKAMTLIEVLVSLAIFSIVIIPLSLLILASVRNNVASENTQQAVSKAQMLIEEIRANNDLGNDRVTVKNGTITLVKKTGLAQGSIEYIALKQDIGDKFKADINIKRKLSYNANTAVNALNSYDLTIIYKDGNLTVNGHSIATDYSGNVQINCKSLEDDSGINKDVIYINGDKTHLYNRINTNVLIYLESDTAHITSVDNRFSNPVSIYTKYDNQAAQDNNTVDVLFGNVYVYGNNLMSQNTTDTDGIYDIKIDIYKAGKETSVYGTKASVSIVK